MKKLTITVAIFTILVVANITPVYADWFSEITDQAESFIDTGATEAGDDVNIITDSTAENFVGIGQVLTFIGVGVLIGATTYLGILYLISPPDKQGAIKEKLTGLAVATVVIFGAHGIWSLVLNIVSKFD